jgi:hypothetical protein
MQAKSTLQKHRQKYEEKCAKGPQRPEFPCVWLEKSDAKQKPEWSSNWKDYNINKSVPWVRRRPLTMVWELGGGDYEVLANGERIKVQRKNGQFLARS